MTDYLTDFRINQTSDRYMNSEKILRQQILKTNQKLKTLKGHLYSGQTHELRLNMKTDYLTEFRIHETSDRHMNSEKKLRQQILKNSQKQYFKWTKKCQILFRVGKSIS